MNDPPAWEIPVLIVGAGPVGLALAGDLGWRGVSALVVERSDGAIDQPRMDYVSARTMEFCRRWGIVADVEATPYPRDIPQDNIYVVGSLCHGFEVGRRPVPSMADTPPLAQSPEQRERCPQNMFDPVLARFAGSHDGVEIRYRHRFNRFEERDDGVEVQLEDLETGEASRIAARYLVGCDGAASAVRQQMGIRMLGDPALTYTTNIIFRCADFAALHGRPPGYRFILIGPDGTWATIVAINGRDQWRMSIVQSSVDGPRELPESEIHDAIVEAVGSDFSYQLLSVVPWTRRELVAESYRSGRVFICGDAAHVTSPTGGFGMNTGIQDAVDLSWKLTAMLAGWGGNGLFESYTLERRPVAVRNVTEASANLRRMLQPKPKPAVFAETPEGAAAREEFGREFSESMAREWTTLGIHLGYFYEGSPVIVPDGTPAPPEDTTDYVQRARPGSRAPHVWLADGRSTLDLFGPKFTLLCLGGSAPDGAALIAAAAERGLPLQVENLDEPPVTAAYEAGLVLVRPDGHVAWRGDAVPQDAGALLDHLRGAADDGARDAALEFAGMIARFWQDRLGADLLGVYLLGSLAHGGFSRRYSDIDVGLVAEDGLTEAMLEDMRGHAARIAPELAPKLSLFWTDRGFTKGRFPPLDRMDYLDHAVALTERERVAPAPPSLEDVRAYLRGAPFENWAAKTRHFATLERLPAEDHKPYLRAHLYPARLIYSWKTGRMASNDDAVAVLRNHPPDGLDVALVTRALQCRHAAADPDELFPDRTRLAAQVAACARLMAAA